MFENVELSALLISVLAGLFLGIPSGPALFFVLDTMLQAGKAAALKVYGGLMGSKLVWIVLALLANNFISANRQVEAGFYLLASFLLMCWGGLILFKSTKKQETTSQGVLGSFYRTGFVVGISNPVIPFIYLTFIQFIKIYANKANTFKYMLNIGIMEAVSFLVLAAAGLMLLSGGQLVQRHWQKLVGVMGVLLICAGGYQVYQLVDYGADGFSINQQENVLEEQLEQVEEITNAPATKK